MLNTMCYVLRFLSKIVKGKSKMFSFSEKIKFTNYLSAEEVKTAQLKLIYLAQKENPPQENEISNLNLKLQNNLWYSVGRISNSLISESEKNPLWMPAKSIFTSLLVYHVHIKLHHAGTINVLNHLRLEFWIPQGRRVVNSIIFKLCLNCRKLKLEPYKRPEFPQLPPERVQKSLNFQNTGVDYFGPLILKNNKKVWVCLFTCMVVRAIHMEVVESLSTDAFIEVLRKFMARRGKPLNIFSDNGKQFVLAKKLLTSNQSKNPIHSEDYRNFLEKNSINWTFITERAPWKGGFYERLIGVVKNHLRRVLSKSSFVLSKFQCIIAEIEFIVNCKLTNKFCIR